MKIIDLKENTEKNINESINNNNKFIHSCDID